MNPKIHIFNKTTNIFSTQNGSGTLIKGFSFTKFNTFLLFAYIKCQYFL